MNSTEAVTARRAHVRTRGVHEKPVRRSVKTVLVVGIELPTLRALGRLLGRYFYIEKILDVMECLRRIQHSKDISAVVIQPELSKFDVLSLARLVRRHQPNLPLFIFGCIQDIPGCYEVERLGGTYCFESPLEIFKLAEAIAARVNTARFVPCLERPEINLVVRALQFVEDNYSSITKVTYISDSLGVSREHLSRQFVRYVGRPLWDFLTIHRINKAKALLMQGYLVKQVAKEAGFCCESSFFRAFLKHTGTTPKSYREERLVGRS